ncbi:hypothetical protein BJ170DRAFT_638812 [Xylariales sp. AK1849]|nr:hypothetical protein BJ170DRAFT_638812 [Xylariales sp. AK1849]
MADSAVICGICLEEVPNPSTALVTLPCGHALHPDCVAEWLSSPFSAHKDCPVCRASLRYSCRHTLSADLLVAGAILHPAEISFSGKCPTCSAQSHGDAQGRSRRCIWCNGYHGITERNVRRVLAEASLGASETMVRQVTNRANLSPDIVEATPTLVTICVLRAFELETILLREEQAALLVDSVNHLDELAGVSERRLPSQGTDATYIAEQLSEVSLVPDLSYRNYDPYRGHADFTEPLVGTRGSSSISSEMLPGHQQGIVESYTTTASPERHEIVTGIHPFSGRPITPPPELDLTARLERHTATTGINPFSSASSATPSAELDFTARLERYTATTGINPFSASPATPPAELDSMSMPVAAAATNSSETRPNLTTTEEAVALEQYEEGPDQSPHEATEQDLILPETNSMSLRELRRGLPPAYDETIRQYRMQVTASPAHEWPSAINMSTGLRQAFGWFFTAINRLLEATARSRGLAPQAMCVSWAYCWETIEPDIRAAAIQEANRSSGTEEEETT